MQVTKSDWFGDIDLVLKSSFDLTTQSRLSFFTFIKPNTEINLFKIQKHLKKCEVLWPVFYLVRKHFCEMFLWIRSCSKNYEFRFLALRNKHHTFWAIFSECKSNTFHRSWIRIRNISRPASAFKPYGSVMLANPWFLTKILEIILHLLEFLRKHNIWGCPYKEKYMFHSRLEKLCQSGTKMNFVIWFCYLAPKVLFLILGNLWSCPHTCIAIFWAC